MDSSFGIEDYFSQFFPFKNGVLHCEGKDVRDIPIWLKNMEIFPYSPVFIYSKGKLVSNVDSYMKPLTQSGKKIVLNYSMKANMNPHILSVMKEMGCSVTLVSGMELQLALKLGFQSNSMVLNGNGKQQWEIELAVEYGCLLNIDSLFNLRQTVGTCAKLGKGARVLLRVNPDIDPNVHHYNTTGKTGTKFGLEIGSLDSILGEIRQHKCLQLVGLHCHLGSTIEKTQVFRESAEVMIELYRRLKSDGFDKLQFLNLGGGLSVPYRQHTVMPSDIIREINEAINSDDDVTVILEPGRSLVAEAGILLTTVLGVKKNGKKNYIVVDGAMTEVIRPALYDAYHHTDLAEPSSSKEPKLLYDIVGPVCESADFLGKNRYLETPHEGCLLAVFDVGAYCSSMGSNYNMRPRPAEVLIDGDHCEVIRAPDTFEDLVAPYFHLHSPGTQKATCRTGFDGCLPETQVSRKQKD